MKTQTARFWLAIGLPAVTLVVGFGSWLMWQDELPNPIATHFDGSGAADGSSSPLGALLGFGIPIAIGVLLCIATVAFSARWSRPIAVSMAFIGGTAAGLCSMILAQILWSQRGLSDWTDARLSDLTIIAVIVIGLAVGAVAARIASYLVVDAPHIRPGDPGAPIMDLHDDEQAVWITSHTMRPLVVVSASVIVGCLIAFVLVDVRGLTLAAPCLIATLLMTLASFRLQVDARGLWLRTALLPWPRMHIAIEEIETASVIDVRPMEWGGWGYRGSLKLMKQAAVVQRAGPGIRLDLTGDRVFVVTTDHPEQPVALLNALARRGRHELKPCSA